MDNNDDARSGVFPELESERLVLRQPELTDAADILAFRGDYDVQKYNGPVLETIAQAEALIDGMRLTFAKQQAIGWAVTLKPHGVVVALFGFHSWDQRHRRIEFGFDLHRAYWGRGLATEAGRVIISYAFDTMKLHRVEAYTLADNYRSVRLLEKLSFSLEGLRRDYVWEDDQRFHDSAVYGLLRHEYSH